MSVTLGRALIEVKADLTDFPSDLRAKLEAALKEGTAGVDTTPFEEKMTEVGEEAGKKLGEGVDREAKKKMEDAGHNAAQRFSYGFTAFLGRMLFNRASMWTSLIASAGAAIGNLMPAIFALAGAAPAALGGLVASAVAVKLAFHGMGQAISGALSGKWSAKDIQALKDLTPAARSFVKEIAQLRPQLQGLQKAAQQALFVQLEGSLTRVARVLLPTVRAGLVQLATGIGGVGRSIANALATPLGRGAAADFFASLNTVMVKLAPALGAVTRAILGLVSASSPFVASLGVGLANVLQRFADFIARVQNSGQLAQFFDTALVVLRDFGTTLGNILVLFNELVSGLGAGGNLLGFLSTLSSLLVQLFASASGKELLATLGELMQVLGTLIVQVLTPLLPAIAQVASMLGQQLITAVVALTPHLVDLANVLVPMLTFVAAHGDVFGPIVLGIVALAAGLKAYAIAQGIAEVATEAATAAMVAFDVAADANPIGAVVLAIELLIAGIVLLVMNWKDVKKYGSEAWDGIKKAALGVWTWLKSAGSDILGFFEGIAAWLRALPGRVVEWLTSLPARFAQLISDAMHLGAQALGFGLGLLLAEAVKFPGQLWDALVDLTHLIGDLLHQGWDNLKAVWSAITGWVATEWTLLPTQIGLALQAIPRILGGLIHDAWDWAKREFRAGADAVVAWAQALPGRISGFFDNVGHAILGGLRSGINQVIDSFNHGIDQGWAAMHLPGGAPFHIPHLAQGGIVDRPTLAVIGEKAREVVLPTDNPRRAWELLQQSGMLGTLQQPMPTPVVYVTAMLDSGDLLRVVDVRVEHALDREAVTLAHGVRT